MKNKVQENKVQENKIQENKIQENKTDFEEIIDKKIEKIENLDLKLETSELPKDLITTIKDTQNSIISINKDIINSNQIII